MSAFIYQQQSLIPQPSLMPPLQTSLWKKITLYKYNSWLHRYTSELYKFSHLFFILFKILNVVKILKWTTSLFWKMFEISFIWRSYILFFDLKKWFVQTEGVWLTQKAYFQSSFKVPSFTISLSVLNMTSQTPQYLNACAGSLEKSSQKNKL